MFGYTAPMITVFPYEKAKHTLVLINRVRTDFNFTTDVCKWMTMLKNITGKNKDIKGEISLLTKNKKQSKKPENAKIMKVTLTYKNKQQYEIYLQENEIEIRDVWWPDDKYVFITEDKLTIDVYNWHQFINMFYDLVEPLSEIYDFHPVEDEQYHQIYEKFFDSAMAFKKDIERRYKNNYSMDDFVYALSLVTYNCSPMGALSIVWTPTYRCFSKKSDAYTTTFEFIGQDAKWIITDKNDVSHTALECRVDALLALKFPPYLKAHPEYESIITNALDTFRYILENMPAF